MARCAYCGLQVLIDKRGAAFSYIVPYLIDRAQAEGIFNRWADGPRKAKDLRAKAKMTYFEPFYFPVYLFRRIVDGREELYFKVAKTTIFPGFGQIQIPAGELKFFDAKFDLGGVATIKPDVEMSTYFDWLPGTPVEQALVYIPFWKLEFGYKDKTYTVIINGSTGETWDSGYPERYTNAYIILTVIAYFIFYIIGTISTFIMTIASSLNYWYIGAMIILAIVALVLPVFVLGAVLIARWF